MKTILQRFGALVCGMKRKHLRGKLDHQMTNEDGSVTRTLLCTRCGAQWKRKLKSNVPPKAGQ